MNSQLPPAPDSAEIAASIQRWASASPELARMIGSSGTVASVLMRWGIHRIGDGHFAEAAAVFRVAAALGPRDPTAWTNYGVALDRSGEPGGAAACYGRSIELKRAQPDAWLLLGLARRKLGSPVEAEAAFREAVALDPASAIGWQCLALALEEQRRDLEAAGCLRRCLECGGASAAVYGNLGKLCHEHGRIGEARAAFEEAARLDAGNAHFREMLRRCRFLDAALHGESLEEAAESYRQSFPGEAPCPEPELARVFEEAFGLFSGYGHLEAAERVGKRFLELWPDNPAMEYLLRAVRSDPAVRQSPARYVASHFDAFAASFDSKLVDRLGYDVPGQIRAAIGAFVPGGGGLDVLDAGCGTGLCGPLLRPLARSLAGVDLSARMIDKARERGVYDRLVCGEIGAFLEGSPGAFDLAVAADVLIYFGDLGPLVAAAARALRPGGVLAFSIETAAAGAAGDEGYRLLPSGRFAHARGYVRQVLGEAFTELAWVETTLRQDADRRLPGELFVFRRREVCELR